MMEQYLTSQSALRGVVLLVDIRHEPSSDDVTMYNFLKHYEIPVILKTQIAGPKQLAEMCHVCCCSPLYILSL